MSPPPITIDDRAALRALDALTQGVREAGYHRLTATSDLPYAGPIERGYTLTGSWRRTAGPAEMFARGTAEVTPLIAPTVAAALPGGAGAVRTAFRGLGERWQSAIRAHTPVVSGRLRASIRVRGLA